MKRIIIIILVTILSTAAGLYFRPSYLLIGQMDWLNVLTKGYLVGSFAGLFSQGYLDESFYFVMRFSAGGLVAGLMLAWAMSGSKKSPAKKKK